MHPPVPQAIVPQDLSPAWSPDGSRIAYYHIEQHEDPALIDPDYPTGLYLLDLETGARSLVIEGFTFSPDWSPDGEWIAFSAGDILTVRPDGTELSTVTDHGMAFTPRWSPHGTALTYGRSGTQETVGLWFAHLGDSELITLARFGFGASPAAWSPDGMRIVFAGPRGEAPGGNQIWVADTSGVARYQMTFNDHVNRHAAWSPDGDRIAWTVLRSGRSEVWLMNSDGTDQHALIEHAQEPAWSPDSEHIVFSRGQEGRDSLTLWSIRRDGTGLRQLTN